MENPNGSQPQRVLFMIVFNNSYFVGDPPKDKKTTALENVVEFIYDPSSKNHIGCFHGTLLAGRLTDRLVIALHPRSALYQGYFRTLTETFKEQEQDTAGSEIPI